MRTNRQNNHPDEVTNHTQTKGLGPTTSHFRHGPERPFNPYQPPETVDLPTPTLPIIEVPSTPEAPQKVPDEGAFTAMGLLVLVALVVVRKFKQK